jgi:hypothetical protein
LPRAERRSQLPWEMMERDGPMSDSMDVDDDARDIDAVVDWDVEALI